MSAYVIMLKYIQASYLLAESVQKDVKKDGKVSKKTLEALYAYIKTAQESEEIIELMSQQNNKLN